MLHGRAVPYRFCDPSFVGGQLVSLSRGGVWALGIQPVPKDLLSLP